MSAKHVRNIECPRHKRNLKIKTVLNSCVTEYVCPVESCDHTQLVEVVIKSC